MLQLAVRGLSLRQHTDKWRQRKELQSDDMQNFHQWSWFEGNADDLCLGCARLETRLAYRIYRCYSVVLLSCSMQLLEQCLKVGHGSFLPYPYQFTIYCHVSTRPDWPWGSPSHLYNGYRVCFSGVKRPGRDVRHPLLSSSKVKERVELHLYSPSGPSWPVTGWNWPFNTIHITSSTVVH